MGMGCRLGRLDLDVCDPISRYLLPTYFPPLASTILGSAEDGSLAVGAASSWPAERCDMFMSTAAHTSVLTMTPSQPIAQNTVGVQCVCAVWTRMVNADATFVNHTLTSSIPPVEQPLYSF